MNEILNLKWIGPTAVTESTNDHGDSAATYPEAIGATGYFFLAAVLALILGGPPLYDSLLAFRRALSSSLTWTIVPEVFDSSLQPIKGRCDPINSVRSRIRPRGKHRVLMSSSLKGDVEGDRPREIWIK
jgi:hypothetical protein